MRMHIGKEIRRIIEQKGITGAWLAEQIGTSKRNLYALLNRAEVSTKQLEEISRALDFDFFQLYASKTLSPEIQGVQESDIEYTSKKKVFVTVELDGGDQSLKEWIRKLNAINQVI